MQARPNVVSLGEAGLARGLRQAPDDLARELATARTPDEIMALVSREVRIRLQADGASFVLRDGDRCYYAEEDAVSPLWKGRRFPMRACISGWCMLHREAVVAADIFQDPRIPVDAYRPTFVRSLIMAPVGREQPIAALGAYWAEMRQPGPEQVAQLQAIADAAAVAWDRVSAAQGMATSSSEEGREKRRPAAPAAASPDSGERAFSGLVARFRRGRLRPVETYAFAVLAVLTATLVRDAFKASGVGGLAVYSTYYPAVLLSMLVGGRRCGLLAAVLGGLAAYYFFMPPLYRFTPLTLSDGLNLTLYGGACALIVLTIDWYKRALLRLRHEDARHLTLAREQAHRVKNAIAVVESVVRQSLGDQPDRARTINRRIRAGLAQIDVHDQPVGGAAPLGELLAAELEPYDLARFILEGEAGLRVGGRTRSIIALVTHELATNALKYGALATPAGQVSVAWAEADGRARIVWAETGGPRVQPPAKRGYGSVLLQRLVQSAGGAFSVDFRPSGVVAEISLQLS